MAILIGSYVASTFVNATHVARGPLTGPRTRTVLVAPAPAQLPDPLAFPPEPPPALAVPEVPAARAMVQHL